MRNVDSEDFLPFYPAFPELSHSQVDTVLWIRMHFSPQAIASMKNIRHDSLRRELCIIKKKLNVFSEKQLEALVDKRLLIFSLCPGALSKIILIHNLN
ncbi:helix-turn-helix transcriptional regulator [Arsenophonus nasoniae]|uniref:Uncharacterized protein n=1 Tax=Arsenophonus nasoniae TaxID=638 RepID=A0AA95GG89_9GAMM|nr:hypothetical protein [Arsenophonus nasoniae]WGL94031.1 hypothetical protein QE207_01660 [Arsenophonus nasoniae]